MSRRAVFARRRKSRRFQKLFQCIESLESRFLLSTVTVNAGTLLRSVPTNLLGVNMATWDGEIAGEGIGSDSLNSQTQTLVAESGLQAFRIPGGSTTDEFHFDDSTGGGGNSFTSQASVAALANLIDSVNGTGVVTVNYGTGSPQEAAALLAYFNAPINNPTIDNVTLGMGEINTASNTTSAATTPWTTQDWGTVGDWADLRAATPLSQDDGLNFLRIGQSNAFTGIHYWEIGNEEYGSFETDAHGNGTDISGALNMPNGKSPKIHDPTTYIAFAKQFATYAAEIDPSISIGVDVDDPGYQSGNPDPYWTRDILSQSAAQGFTPGFLSDHMYPFGPGGETDSGLLAVPDESNPFDLSQRAAAYKQDLVTAFGSTTAAGIELLGTEINSVYGDPGKQSVSLVNGLFIADSIGAALDTGANGTTGYDGLWVWDLHNGPPSPAGNQSSSLYGWRTGFGDYGLLGANFGGIAEDAPNVQFPDYFAEQLASKIVQSGGEVVSSSSDSANFDTFAVIEPDGDLALLIINKNADTNGKSPNNLPDGAINETFALNGFTPLGPATMYQYGPTEDDAAYSSGSGGTYATSLTTSNPTITFTGNKFTLSVPDYSMTVLDLAPALGVSSPNHATFNVGQDFTFPVTTTAFVGGTVTYSGATLPTGVTFSANGNGTALLEGDPAVGTGGTYALVFAAGTATQNFVLTVDQTPSFTNDASTTFMQTGSNSFGIATSAYPVATVSESGTLPHGVTFHAESNGAAELIGTPSAGTGGTYVLTLTAKNVVGTVTQAVTQSFSLVVDQAVKITSAKTANLTIGQTGSFLVTTSGPPPATSFGYSGNLPTGLNIQYNGNGTETIFGTPSASAGTYGLTLSAINGIGTVAATQVLTLDINLAPAIVSPTMLTLTAGVAESFNVWSTAYPTPTLKESGALPPGLRFSDDHDGTATISGTPSSKSATNYMLTLMSGNVASTATQTLTLTIQNAPTFTNSNHFSVAPSTTFPLIFTTSGFPIATLSDFGTLPAGLTFSPNNNGTASLTGTVDPSTPTTYVLYLSAINSISTATQKFTLIVT